MKSQLTKTLIFYFFMLVGPVSIGLYWVYYQNGQPDKIGVAILIFYCALLGIIRNIQVGVSFVDFSLNIKKKLNRLRRIWLP